MACPLTGLTCAQPSMTDSSSRPALSLTIYTPAGVLAKVAPLRLAARRLKAMGYAVTVDEAATARHQRFAGTDEQRLQAVHRVAQQSPDIALAARGGYGLSRLLDAIQWPLLARSVERGTRWVGYSDLTALNLALLAHTQAPTWAGTLAVDDFGQPTLDDVSVDCFNEAMHGELEAVGFRTAAGLDGLQAKGLLWGGNLTMVCALLGTRHWPRVKGGLLFLEDVNEHPYRIERNLLHLLHAGVIDAQKAVILGQFTAWKPAALDRGYTLKSAVQALQSRTKTPILTGLPLGHVATHVTLPVGRRAQLLVQGRDALVGW
jgi:muramoyltetrapeptide carboxypeptidase